MVHFCTWQGPTRPIGGHHNHDGFFYAMRKSGSHYKRFLDTSPRADKTWLLSSAVNKRSTSSNSLGKFAFFVLSNQFSHDFTHWSWEMCIEPLGITLRLITNSLHFWIKIEVIQLCIWASQYLYTKSVHGVFFIQSLQCTFRKTCQEFSSNRLTTTHFSLSLFKKPGYFFQ